MSSRRDEILAEAARLFAGRGFHGVGVDDIGASVGLSGPALYRHFPSKDAMLAEMLVQVSDRLLTVGRERVQGAATAEDALDTLVRWHIEFALGNPELITVQDRDLANCSDPDRRRVRRLQRRYVEVWVGVLAAAHPGCDRGRLRAAAHAVFGLLNSTPHSALGVDGEAMADLLREMALAAFASATAGAGSVRGGPATAGG